MAETSPGLVADWPGMPRVGILPKEAACWGVVATAVLRERERWLPVGWAGLRTTGEARRNASGQRQPGRLCARSVRHQAWPASPHSHLTLQQSFHKEAASSFCQNRCQNQNDS